LNANAITENAGGSDSLPKFDAVAVFRGIDSCSDQQLDRVDFGVIGFDHVGNVCRYNAVESKLAGLAELTVLGHHLFDVVAPCMNNFMVAQLFEDALAHGRDLDAVIDYVLTLRMRPQRVKLRLLAQHNVAMRYILIQRNL
jgi:photoactive yellow protein